MPSTPGMSRPVPYSSTGPSRKSSRRAVRACFPGRPQCPRGRRSSRAAGEQPPGSRRSSLPGSEPRVSRPGAGRRCPGQSAGMRGSPLGQAGPPERREHLVRSARSGPDGPRLEQEVRLEAGGVDALIGGPFLDPGVDGAFGTAVAPVPQEMRGPFRLARSRMIRRRRSAPEQQPGTLASRSADRDASEWWSHHLAAPPSGRMPARLLIQDVHHGHRRGRRAAASARAGLSSRRRSSRSQTMVEGMVPRYTPGSAIYWPVT